MIKKILIGIALTVGFLPTEAVPVSFSAEQQCLAANIYFESRGEGTAGQIAVGQVVLNRVDNERFPDSICEVIQEGVLVNGRHVKNRCQFSWYCDGKPEVITDTDSFERAYELAAFLLNSEIPDITDGALYFHSNTVNPKWKRKRTVRIGNHTFYK